MTKKPVGNGEGTRLPETSEASLLERQTKNASKLAGLTESPLAGLPSYPSLKDGDESAEMLLALLNNALASLLATGTAKILGRGLMKGRLATVFIVYGVSPTKDGILVRQK